jgi:hypothetical protein
LKLAAALLRQFGIPLEAWDQKPTEPFVPPARAALLAELAGSLAKTGS